MSERVTLRVPARGEFARTVRITAAQLASQMDMSIEDVEDVRLAAEEAFVWAVDGLGGEDTVVVEFELSGDALTLTVNLGDEAELDAEAATDLSAACSRLILESICDSVEVTHDAEPVLRIRKVKSSEESPAETSDAV